MSSRRGAKTVMTAVLLGLLAAAPAAADVRTAVTLEALLAGLSDPDAGMLLGGGGSARLDLAATGNRNVRGQLSLRAELLQEGGDDGAAVRGVGGGARLSAGAAAGVPPHGGKDAAGVGPGPVLQRRRHPLRTVAGVRGRCRRVPDRRRMAGGGVRAVGPPVLPGAGRAAPASSARHRAHRRRRPCRGAAGRADRGGRLPVCRGERGGRGAARARAPRLPRPEGGGRRRRLAPERRHGAARRGRAPTCAAPPGSACS